MSKSDVTTLVAGGRDGRNRLSRSFDPAAAQDLTNWLRQEIRKEVPQYKPVGSPNYAPVIPAKGL